LLGVGGICKARSGMHANTVKTMGERTFKTRQHEFGV
jgi:hypothetical protein